MYHGGTHDGEPVKERPGISKFLFVAEHPSFAILAGVEYDYSSDESFEKER